MWPFKKSDPVRKIVIQQRKFAAAQMSGLLNNWQRATVQINKELQNQGAALRNRARETAKNDSIARKYLNILKTNVVGQNGIRLQARAKNAKGQLDSKANSMIEAAWADYSRAVDNTGRLSLVDLQTMVIDNAARDGEVLLREIVGFPNRWGYAVQVLDVAQLDEQHNQKLKNGREIRLGIEFDAYGRPVAYHLKTTDKTANSYYFDGVQRVRIPAAEIIHLYRPEFANQDRGFTWMSASLVDMHHLAAFNEAAIIAARIGASSMGFFTEGIGSEFQGDDKLDTGDLQIDLEPGTFRKLPAGVNFEAFDSKYPSDMVDGFQKRALKNIASGLNVSYPALASDPADTSYGTLRAFTIDDRDYFKTLQRWLADGLLARIYRTWLDKAIDGPHLPLKDSIDKYFDIRWQPRGWQWIDPAKDAAAYRQLLESKLTAPSMVAAEQGRDFEEVCQQIAADMDLMKQYGIAPEPIGVASNGN